MNEQYFATDFMVDIETLGKLPGSVVTAIGIAAFRRYGFSDTPPRIESMRIVVALAPQIARGLTIDPETMLWWMKQPVEARDDWASDEAQMAAELPSRALDILANWINGRAVGSPWFWGNSPSFDFGLLAPLYRIAGREPPWSYSKERDIRTLGSVFGDVKRPSPTVAHSAAADAVAQAAWVQAIYAHMAGKPYATIDKAVDDLPIHVDCERRCVDALPQLGGRADEKPAGD